MVLIVLLYVASIACCNWFLHGEEEGNIFMNINEGSCVIKTGYTHRVQSVTEPFSLKPVGAYFILLVWFE